MSNLSPSLGLGDNTQRETHHSPTCKSSCHSCQGEVLLVIHKCLVLFCFPVLTALLFGRASLFPPSFSSVSLCINVWIFSITFASNYLASSKSVIFLLLFLFFFLVWYLLASTLWLLTRTPTNITHPWLLQGDINPSPYVSALVITARHYQNKLN